MMHSRPIRYFALIVAVVAGVGVFPAWAQEAVVPPAPPPAADPAQMLSAPIMQAPLPVEQPVISPVPQVASASKSPNPSTARGTIALPSLFFTPEERETINRAREQYVGGGPTEETEADLLDQLQGIKSTSKKLVEEPVETTHPQFYLVSLMYHNANDWAVWVKDIAAVRKLDPTNLAFDPTMNVISVAQESVVLEWMPRNWTHVARAFKPNTPGVSINSQLKRVRFIVRVNQTFESGTMEVKEGVVSPVQVTQQVAVPATITTPQEKTENPLPAAEADDKNSSTPP